MEMRKFNTGSFLKGLAIGGILASLVVLFTAPHSGAETRRLIQEKSEDLRDRSVKSLQDARQRMDTIVSETLDRADQMVRQIGGPAESVSQKSQS